MNKYVGYIYCVTNLVNRKRYVGQTNTPVSKRYAEHLRCANSDASQSILLYRAIRKYGAENFSVSILQTVSADSKTDLKSILNEREIFYISELGTYKPDGYNMTLGGNAFADHVVKPVIKVASDGFVLGKYDSIYEAEVQNGLPVGTVKRAFTYSTHYAGGFFWYAQAELDAEVGDYVGRQCSREVFPVYQFSLDGIFICRYDSANEAESVTGVSCTSIRRACNHDSKSGRLSAGGFLWSHTDTPPLYCSTQKTHKCKPVMQLSLDGAYIQTFSSATEAANALGLTQVLISKCCRGERKSTGGYRWAFINS